MGKTQSKRSVDITTESKKNPDEDVTGKLEKIEDLDQQKQVNGDASSQENAETEKKEGDETENDKDLTTEKSVGESGAQDGGGDTNTGQSDANAAESNSKVDESAASKDGNKTAEEISPLSDEANKKPKKEKVKKKWSFRSISFGKKDKQKPAKAEDAAAENAAATNGEGAAQSGEGAATEENAEKIQNDEAAGDAEKSPTENGERSEKQLNGEKSSTTTTPTEEQPAKEISSNENTTITNITTNNTTETTSTVVIETSSNTTATENNQTEKQTTNTATNLAAETPESASAAAAVIVSNGDAIEKNGIDTLSSTAVDDQKDQVTVRAAADLLGETSDVADKIKSIPNVVNELSDNNGVHQNGTSANGEELEPEIESKSQVEVIFQTDKAAHTDELVTLNTATTSSSPNTTPILSPDPTTNITVSTTCENNDNDAPPPLLEEVEATAAIFVESLTSAAVVDVAIKTNEPVVIATISDVEQTEAVVTVDTGNVELNVSEPEKDIAAAQSHNEDDIEDTSTAQSVTSIAIESPKPPPLPVSPPPSQVSVFAFNDNVETMEEGICDTNEQIVAENVTVSPITTNTETAHADNESITTDVQKDTTTTAYVEIVDIAAETSTQALPTETNVEITKTPPTNIDIVEPSELLEAPEPTVEQVEGIPLNVAVEIELSNANLTNTDKTEEVATVPAEILESTEEQCVKAATAVVDEITEKAVELIQQQNDQQQQPEIIETAENITAAAATTTTIHIIKTDDVEIININNEVNDDIKNVEISLPAKDTSLVEVIEKLEAAHIQSMENTDSDKNTTTPLNLETHLSDCLKTTDKHIVEEENKDLAAEICSQAVVSVIENEN